MVTPWGGGGAIPGGAAAQHHLNQPPYSTLPTTLADDANQPQPTLSNPNRPTNTTLPTQYNRTMACAPRQATAL